MEKLIEELEKKKTEIYTDIEDIEWNEKYEKGYVEAWLNAFDIAILIVKENSYLFKE